MTKEDPSTAPLKDHRCPQGIPGRFLEAVPVPKGLRHRRLRY